MLPSISCHKCTQTHWGTHTHTCKAYLMKVFTPLHLDSTDIFTHALTRRSVLCRGGKWWPRLIYHQASKLQTNPAMKICPEKCQEDINSNTSKRSWLPAWCSQPFGVTGGRVRRGRCNFNLLWPSITRQRANKDTSHFRPNNNIHMSLAALLLFFRAVLVPMKCGRVKGKELEIAFSCKFHSSLP